MKRTLINELKQCADEEGNVIIDDQINKFINDYITEEMYLYSGAYSDTCENKYHEFCILQKHKCLVTSRSHVIIEFIRNNYSNDWTIQSYCDNLFYTINNLEYRQDENIEQNIDIIMCLIKDLKNKEHALRISPDSISNLKSLLKNNSQRLKFIVEDIGKTN
jgi:hypothetical protein